jgi:ubiquinone/menaquinone biosynthesis C-methylase UbiE
MKNRDAKSYYNEFSSWYENNRHHGYHAMLDELELNIITPYAKNADILEIGCGTGLIMNGLKEHAKSITGLDISKGMIAKARQRGFTTLLGSATDLPFKNNHFVLVYSYKVLAHVPDIKTAMEEMSRVLKPGGIMVAEFYNAISLRHLAKAVAKPGKISKNTTEDSMYTRWDTPRQIESYIPFGTTLKKWQGVRVFTPSAGIYNFPLFTPLLKRAENWAVSSPFAKFAGFIIAVCQKS